MKMKKRGKASEPETTSHQLNALTKSARRLMRKDKGLNGDLDRLPQLTWIMFLKFLDDMESVYEDEAKLSGRKYRASIERPYRWRDWAAKEDGITGDELLAFVNQDEAIRPDGKRAKGLFKYLRELESRNGRNREDVIANIFSGALNRMINGYLLRDVINQVNKIDFASSDAIHTLGHIYERMLREMRDAAGDSGEFYTPRPVIRLMVEAVNPQLGESLLDPACGTGGFLCESYKHIEKSCETVEDRRFLQEETLFGQEAKPLPYMLCQMNLLLHGMEFPNIKYGNSLAEKIAEIGDRDRVDLIITNPPFGGEEERGIRANFPNDLQTSETALLFLQLIMRKLKRSSRKEGGGRAAVIVPNGALYAAGVAERVRKQLVEEFQLHTIVRLPKGVFEPYADIPTNILFFSRAAPVDAVWFYEHPLPQNRARLRAPCYSMSEPLRYEEFLPLLAWWGRRSHNEHAWQVSAQDLRLNNYNFDYRNPHNPEQTVINLKDYARDTESATLKLTSHLRSLSRTIFDAAEVKIPNSLEDMTYGTIGQFCDLEKGKSPTKKTDPGNFPFIVTAAIPRTADHFDFDRPAVCVPTVSSTGHGHASINRIHYIEGKFALANIMAAISVKAGVELEPKYLYYYLWVHKDEKLVSLMAGTANTSLTIAKLKTVEIVFPKIAVQREIVPLFDRMFQNASDVRKRMIEMVEKEEELKRVVLRSCMG